MNIRLLIRIFRKNWKGNIVSLVGLSVGMMVAILSVSYIIFESSYDTFHSKSDRIYTVYTKISSTIQEATSYSTEFGMKDFAVSHIPLVESACRMKEITTNIISGNRVFKDLSGYYTDPEFFHLFDFRMLSGDPGFFSEPGKIIITASLSERLFGNSNSIGGIVQINDLIYAISGIVDDPPLNSNFNFDFLIPLLDNSVSGESQFGDERVNLYLLAASEQKTTNLLKESLDEHYVLSGKDNLTNELIALKDLHQYGEKTKRNFLIFITVSLLVLLTSVVNYINIFYVGIEVRAKEIGIRKVTGASRGTIIRMKISESVLMTIMASVVGLILSYLFLDQFQKLSSVEVQQYGPGLWKIQVIIVSVALILGTAIGFLSSMKYSDYNPVDLVKGIIKTGHKNFIRKMLIGLQFVISGGLMILMVIFSLQLNFLFNTDMGYDTSNRMLISLSGEHKSKYSLIHDEISGIPGVEYLTGRGGSFSNPDIAMPVVQKNSEPVNHLLTFGYIVEDDFFETYGINLVEGKTFRDISGRDSSLAVIDKFSANQLGFEFPVGEKFKAAGRTVEIIGVVEDADFLALNQEKRPRLYCQFFNGCSELTVKYSGDEKTIVTKIGELLTRIDPEYVLEYQQLDDAVMKWYNKEINLLRIISICGLIAILLSLTGAYAMASFLAERRLKQNSIRRVFGASERNIGLQSIYEIGWPVILGTLLSWPVAYIISRNWLSHFAGKITTGVFPFLISLAMVSLLVFLTIYSISRRSALRNPADLLREE